jgi:hypothetical protein
MPSPTSYDNLAERFAAKTRAATDLSPNGMAGCLLWIGAKNGQRSYGNMKVNQKPTGAHRVAYELRHGPIPEGLEIDHLCRRTSCVNADHLEAVTHTTNVRRRHDAVITDEGAAAVRTAFAAGVKRRIIAEEHGISLNYVYLIARLERRAPQGPQNEKCPAPLNRPGPDAKSSL